MDRIRGIHHGYALLRYFSIPNSCTLHFSYSHPCSSSYARNASISRRVSGPGLAGSGVSSIWRMGMMRRLELVMKASSQVFTSDRGSAVVRTGIPIWPAKLKDNALGDAFQRGAGQRT